MVSSWEMLKGEGKREVRSSPYLSGMNPGSFVRAAGRGGPQNSPPKTESGVAKDKPFSGQSWEKNGGAHKRFNGNSPYAGQTESGWT